MFKRKQVKVKFVERERENKRVVFCMRRCSKSQTMQWLHKILKFEINRSNT